jgi:hypothetical protein
MIPEIPEAAGANRVRREVTSVSSMTWRIANDPEAADRERRAPRSGSRPPVAEPNGRSLSRRPTRIVAGPPSWVVRRQEI